MTVNDLLAEGHKLQLETAKVVEISGDEYRTMKAELERLREIAAKMCGYPNLHTISGKCEAEDCEEAATDVAWDYERCKHISVCEQHGRQIGERGEYTGCCSNCGCWFVNG